MRLVVSKWLAGAARGRDRASRGGRPKARSGGARLGLILLALCRALLVPFILFALASCSSAPKAPDEVFDVRNKSSDYLKLADGLVSQGQYEGAEKFYRQAMDGYSSVDWLSGTALAHHSLGRLRLLETDLEGAAAEFTKAADYARLATGQADAALAASLAAAGLGEVAFRRGDKPEALERFEEAVNLAGTDERALAVALHDRASANSAAGDQTGATADLDRAAAINRKLKRWAELASNDYLRSLILERQGDLAGALAQAGEALANDRKAENSYGVTGDLARLGELSTKLGKTDEAYWYWRRAFDAALGANLPRETLRALDGLLGVLEAAGRGAETKDWSSMRDKLAKIAGPGK